ncbi:MAG: prenyltransferase, partial [Methanomassiliicoccus sp.]|nr:prenyltransferase [Methanomassiliicoccus sp.]
SALVIYLTGFHPLSVLVLLFPAFPLMLLFDHRKDINKLYWRLPYVNNLLGGLLFSIVVLGLALQG